MESFLFAAGSLLILLPIVYFLPLGFSLKGKMFIIVASLLIGLFGLVSVAVMPLWQTGLILLVFVSALVYLVSKRNLDWLYVSEVDVDPFELEKAEEKALPVKEMNETYSYIASSEKIPKGIGAEETIPPSRKKDSAPIELGLLEKLVAQNQKNLTLINKSPYFDDREDIQELVTVDEKPNPLVPEIKEQIMAVNEQEDRNLELVVDGEPLDHITTVNSIPEMSSFLQLSDDIADSDDIEAIILNTDDRLEEMEPLPIQVDDSHGYLSELEKMLDADELGFNHDILMDKEQVEKINNPEIDPIPSFQLKTDDELEEQDSLAWLDDEDELAELELIEVPARKSVTLSVPEHTFMDDEFELEELVFTEQNTLPNIDKQKEKEQKMADNDQHMIKQ